MFTQRFIGAPQFVRPNSIGQADANAELQKLQATLPQLQPPTQSIQKAGDQLNTMLTQQAAQYQQAQDTLSNLWWSQNWPYVAGGAALLGLAGILIWKKA